MRNKQMVTLCAVSPGLPAGAFANPEWIRTAPKEVIAPGFDPDNTTCLQGR